MANLRETPTWEAGIYQLETSDPVMGGENGIDNRAPRQLANRTLWLKNELARQIELINNTKLAKTDNAVSASKLATTRNISMTGDGVWNVSFDGTQNATGAFTLANSGVTAGSYNSVTVDAKGRVTRGLTQTHGLVTATTATGTANTATTNGNTFLNIVASGVGTANSVGSSTQITGTNGISVSSDTAGKLIVAGTRASDTAAGVTQLSHETNGTDKTKAASEYALGEVRRMANQAQVTADGIALTWNNVQNKPANLATTDSNVASATKLQTTRNISMTGDGVWNVSFDGTQNATGAFTLANSGVTAGSYNSVTVDAKGRVTRGLTQTHGLVTATTATGTANTATTNGNTFLNIVASGVGTANSVGSSTQITGTNGISVSSDTAGKVLITQDDTLKTINYNSDKSSQYQKTGFYRADGLQFNGKTVPRMSMHITHPQFVGNAHARGIGFNYGGHGWHISTTAWSEQGEFLGERKIYTEEDSTDSLSTDSSQMIATANAVKRLNDEKLGNSGHQTINGQLGITRNAWEKMRFTNQDGSFWRFETAPVSSGENGARFNWVFTGDNGSEIGRITFPRVSSGETIAYQSWVQNANVASATKLQNARTISMTGDGVWNVNFDGTQNATGTFTLANSGVTAGSYNSVTVDAKGRVTRGLTQTHGLVTATTATGTANTATTNGNTFLNIVASGVGTANSVGSSTQITGTNGISVSSDTAGKLIVTRDNNSPTASKLQTARNIALAGAVTGNVNFDGSGNVSLATTVQSVSGQVVVMTGTIEHGQTIPLPAGFSENQCKWLVSIADFETIPHVANNQGNDILAIKCHTTGRTVTAQVAMVNTSRGQLTNAWKNIQAHYIIIGVK